MHYVLYMLHFEIFISNNISLQVEKSRFWRFSQMVMLITVYTILRLTKNY